VFAVIDLETTGGSYRYERIIEIAIVIFDGEKINDEFQTLVNPERSIPPNITRLTGISNEMVVDSPKFFEVAKKVVEITENQVFVAHNVNFDYNFLRQEYQSLGFNFSRKKVCTVQLSRKLIPGISSYGLGALSKELGIKNNARHRAMGDAKATTELLKLLLQRDQKNIIHKAIIRNPVLAGLHEHLKEKDIKALPTKRGVYFFYNKDGYLVYVGKSNNIRDRIMGHLNNQSPGKYQELKASIARIDYQLVAGEIAALILEADQIVTKKPFFNRALKPREVRYHIRPFLALNGLKGLEIYSGNDRGDSIFSFRSLWAARDHMELMAEQYGYCPDFSPEKAGISNPCPRFDLGNCPGACRGKVDVEQYNLGIDLLLKENEVPGGRWALVEEDNFGKSSAILVDEGNVVGLVPDMKNFSSDGVLKICEEKLKRTSSHRNLRKTLIRNIRGLEFEKRSWNLIEDKEVVTENQESNSEVK
jgi:DNA polymerase III subunit epsilon